MAVTQSTLRQRLKQATEPAHVSLEANVGALDSIPGYARYLIGQHAFRAAVEAWLADFPVATDAWRPQRLAAELRHDLTDLGLPLLAPSAISAHAPNENFVMGVHYVLEGSALGARVLTKHVEPLGITRDHGARHLWAQSDSLGNFRAYRSCSDRRPNRWFAPPKASPPAS
ncbi:MAG TPA: biliverdin-producing heme oxygenase [Verrucomicrobiae bacterium]|nr:biliverdin-producing heme oxygenase [Verrucomicrobiae bacterium]